MTAPEPVAAQDHAALLVANLSTVDRIVAAVVRRFAVGAEDAEEFGSWVRERLVEHDYAILRKFGGRSSLATYLTVVITNLYRDFRNARWGRWRPSAAARKLGPLALQLEALLYRDGLSMREALAALRARGEATDDAELRRLQRALPVRTRARQVSLEVVGETAGGPPADAAVAAEDQAHEATLVRAGVARALARLPAEDQAVVRMRFWDGYSIADIARTLRLEQKPLYRRLERVLGAMREGLEAEGIRVTAITELVQEDAP